MATATKKRTSLYSQARTDALGGRASSSYESVSYAHAFLGGEVDRVRVRAYYPPTRQMRDITSRIDSLSFTESGDQAAVQGSATIDNADGLAGNFLNRPGMIVFLETAGPGRKFVERYRFVVWESSVTDLTQGQITWTLYDHMIFLMTATVTARYGRDKHHPHGWTASQIVADLCRKHRIPVKSIVRTTHHIKRFHVEGTFYDVVAKAYTFDTRKTKRNYFILAEQGKLRVRRRQRRTLLMAFDERHNMRQAAFTRALGQGVAQKIVPKNRPLDSATSTPKQTKGKTRKPGERASKRKREHADRQASTTLFGYLTYRPSAGTISDPDYTRAAAQDLADTLGRAAKSLNFTATGNILLRHGDRIYARVTFAREAPLRKELYISSITHNLTPGDYTVDVTCAWRAREVAVRADTSDVNADQAAGSGGSTTGSGPNGTFTKDDLVALCTQTGFADPNQAAAISMAESHGQPEVTSANPDGGTNIGLFQIDDKAHPQYDSAKLRQPGYNAQAAYEISNGGTNWGAWQTFVEGTFRQYL